MPRSNDGRYLLDTGTKMYEVRRLQPRNKTEKEQENEKGPLFHIVCSTDTYEQAVAERNDLMLKFESKVRVKIIPSQREFEAIARGEFSIYETQNQPN